MKIELKCKRKDCDVKFLFDSEKYPPQMYCSPSCSQLARTRKWRAGKKAQQPPGDSSGTEPSGDPERHGDTPES